VARLPGACRGTFRTLAHLRRPSVNWPNGRLSVAGNPAYNVLDRVEEKSGRKAGDLRGHAHLKYSCAALGNAEPVLSKRERVLQWTFTIWV
jgi:hypothetical protein